MRRERKRNKGRKSESPNLGKGRKKSRPLELGQVTPKSNVEKRE